MIVLGGTPYKPVPLIFERSSVAFDHEGNSVPANTPIFVYKVPDGGGGSKLIEGYGCFETRTNIMPATQSQSLSSPYTTAALTGTYTFSIQGEGTITLSGGATGTVSFGNPVTATISGATVTLTPTGTATLVQITKTAYSLPWGLGGVTVAGDVLKAPSTVFNFPGGTPNTGQGTFECEYYPLSTPNSTRYIFNIENGSDMNNRVYSYFTASQLYCITISDNSSQKSVIDGAMPTLNSWNKLGGRFAVDSLKLYKAGVQTGWEYTSSYVPVTYSNPYVYLGCRYDGSGQINGIIRNFTFSKIKRTDTDILTRANKGELLPFGMDRNVTMAAELKNNLKAYKVSA